MTSLKNMEHRARVALKSPRGRDALMFLLFVAISAILWCVLSLNEEEQYDVRMPVRITHVPDSVTLITPGPEALTVSLRARGTQLLKMHLGNVPAVNIDFRAYRVGKHLFLSNAELKALARTASGGSQVSVVYPDTISIPYTTHPGFKIPVSLDVRVTAGPRSALTGRPRPNIDSVRVFMTDGGLPDNFTAVKTEPVRLEGIDGPQTVRTRLIAPTGSRVIPDSIDIAFDVEPLIIKSRRVVIEPVNVPPNIKLITFPAQIEVAYMVPMSAYTNTDPHFRVVADYRRIDRNAPTTRMRLRLEDVPANLQNVHLSADSAEYIIEHL